ncbi:hypothetical protein IE81DRAFT_325680 [Ceraceosorus guamensis]|uniref:Uncharacterized protein n=1 Tax=Ceraceosorus guamensis TaxID=1522189 RepID=A0A316VXX4_9BASI|nr:hypothetical protein IE81DRAFT_325680 [Ceraceosorus guamensis]PWN40325.1 hypothetical protein IE81DRAFT_325680 [Ceraceosorus guamensis]
MTGHAVRQRPTGAICHRPDFFQSVRSCVLATCRSGTRGPSARAYARQATVCCPTSARGTSSSQSCKSRGPSGGSSVRTSSFPRKAEAMRERMTSRKMIGHSHARSLVSSPCWPALRSAGKCVATKHCRWMCGGVWSLDMRTATNGRSNAVTPTTTALSGDQRNPLSRKSSSDRSEGLRCTSKECVESSWR